MYFLSLCICFILCFISLSIVKCPLIYLHSCLYSPYINLLVLFFSPFCENFFTYLTILSIHLLSNLLFLTCIRTFTVPQLTYFLTLLFSSFSVNIFPLIIILSIYLPTDGLFLTHIRTLPVSKLTFFTSQHEIYFFPLCVYFPHHIYFPSDPAFSSPFPPLAPTIL